MQVTTESAHVDSSNKVVVATHAERILMNAEAIAVNQDKLGAQCTEKMKSADFNAYSAAPTRLSSSESATTAASSSDKSSAVGTLARSTMCSSAYVVVGVVDPSLHLLQFVGLSCNCCADAVTVRTKRK